MTAVGIVFSNIHDRNIPEMTRERTMASVPFGGRYRLIDFVLSNMVNAGLTTVGVITKTNYQSLMQHLGAGRDWDLDRKKGGLIILPPYGEAESSSLYNNRLEALKGVTGFLDGASEEYVVMADCDVIANVDLTAVMEDHKRSGADLTTVYYRTTLKGTSERTNTVLTLDDNSRVIGLATYQGGYGERDVSMNIWVIKRTYLQAIVYEALAHGMSSFSREVLAPNLDRIYVKGFEHKGYCACIDSVQTYLESSLELLNGDVRSQLFGAAERPVYTRVKDSPPTKYGSSACVRNSMVADGCVIEGTVENSVLFRGVKVGRNTVIRNSIVMQDTVMGDNVVLNYIITDKRVTIKDGRVLSGHQTHPFYISGGSMI